MRIRRVMPSLAIYILTLGTAWAQSGKVVLLRSGQTVEGDVSFVFREYYQNDQVVVRNDDGKSVFTPTEVRKVYKSDGSQYTPIKHDGKFQFVLVVSEGYLGFYKYKNPEVPGSEFGAELLVKQNGETLDLQKRSFRKNMITFLSDCPPLVRELKEKKSTKVDLHRMILDYNQFMNDISVTGTIEVDGNTLVLIQQIKKEISNAEGSKDQEDLVEMLNDLITKLENGESVPKYLKKSISKGLKKHKDQSKTFESLVF